MPSWPTRLFLGSSAATNNSPSTPLAPTNDPPTPLRSQPAQLSSSALPSRTSQHSRSFSHPFPSIFGSGKKKAIRNEIEDEDEDDDVVNAKTQLLGTVTSSTPDPLSHAHTVSSSGSIGAASVLSLSRGGEYKLHVRT